MLAWFHTLNPVIVELFSGVAVRWYGVAYSTGFVVAFLWMRWLARRRITPLSETFLFDGLTWLVLGVIVGGRLGYVIFYDPALFVTFSKSLPFWGVLMVNRGGMASHGGIAGVIIACFLLARRARKEGIDVPAFHILDICALVCTPGLGFGRLANFINGELLGRIIAPPGEKGPSWSVQFPQEVMDGHAPPLTPAQEEALVRIVKLRAPGMPFEEGYARVLHLIQTLPREKSRELVAELSPLISYRHPSQLYQFFAEGVVLCGSLWLLWRVPRKPGFIGCWFLIIYGILRILTEFWRLPDADLAVQRIAGLSRGQWLSVAMIAAGVLILRLMVQRSRFDRLGGWGVASPRPS